MMKIDIEDRLYVDAARQPDVEPPSLYAAIDRVVSARPSVARRRMLMPMTAAASVAIAIAGVAVAAHTVLGGTDRSASGGRAGRVGLLGVVAAPPGEDQRTVTVALAVSWRCTTETPTAARLRLSGESGREIRMTLGAAGRGRLLTAVPGRSLGTGAAGPNSTEPPQGGNVPTGAPATGGSCVRTRLDNVDVRLGAVPGGRKVVVDGARVALLDPDFAPRPRHLPAGYRELSSGTITDQLPLLANAAYERSGYASLAVTYGNPADVHPAQRDSVSGAPPATVVRRVTVNGHRATVRDDRQGHLEISWLLASGAMIDVSWDRKDPRATISVDELCKVARSIR